MSYPTLTRETRSNDVLTSGSFLGGFAVPLQRRGRRRRWRRSARSPSASEEALQQARPPLRRVQNIGVGGPARGRTLGCRGGGGGGARPGTRPPRGREGLG